LIVVDANAIAHIAKHSMKNLSFEDKGTGVIFGFFNHIIKLAELFESNRFIFAWDSETSFRKLFYSDYKANRGDKNEEQKELDAIAYPQFEALRKEILPAFGFKHNFSQYGHEADDIIASVCKHSEIHQSIIIVTSDKDIFQLITKHRHVYTPGPKKLWTDEIFREQYNIEPLQWVEVLCIAGCSTDNVKGIEGVGEKKAIAFLNNKLPKKGKIYAKIQSNEGQEIRKRNDFLVRLPFKGTRKFSWSGVDHFEADEFESICLEYGFRYFLRKEQYEKWNRIFFSVG